MEQTGCSGQIPNCHRHRKHGDESCDHRRSHRAVDVEGAVWGLVSSLLIDPDRLRAGLDAMIEAEGAAGRGDPEAEAAVWLGRLAALGRKRARFQDMAAEGHMTFEELGERLREVDAGRLAAERELTEVEGRRSRIEELERDRDALLEHYSSMVPEALEELTGEERHQVYRMLHLHVHLYWDGALDVDGAVAARTRLYPDGYAVVCPHQRRPSAVSGRKLRARMKEPRKRT